MLQVIQARVATDGAGSVFDELQDVLRVFRHSEFSLAPCAGPQRAPVLICPHPSLQRGPVSSSAGSSEWAVNHLPRKRSKMVPVRTYVRDRQAEMREWSDGQKQCDTNTSGRTAAKKVWMTRRMGNTSVNQQKYKYKQIKASYKE